MRLILFLFVSIFFGCYTMYGVVLQEEMSNQIKSQDHVNYKLSGEIPESIIFNSIPESIMVSAILIQRASKKKSPKNIKTTDLFIIISQISH